MLMLSIWLCLKLNKEIAECVAKKSAKEKKSLSAGEKIVTLGCQRMAL